MSDRDYEALRAREDTDHYYGDPREAGSHHPDARHDPAPETEEEEEHGDH